MKKGNLKSDVEGKDPNSVQPKFIYIDGALREEPVITLRVGSKESPLTKGEYFIFYRADFNKYHLVKKLNLVFYSPFFARKTDSEVAEIERVKAKLKAGGYDNMPVALDDKSGTMSNNAPVLGPSQSVNQVGGGVDRPFTPAD